MSEIGERYCNNVKCGKRLERQLHHRGGTKCPYCTTEQYESVTNCRHCYWPSPVHDYSGKCLKCGKSRYGRVDQVPCILCETWLTVGAKTCHRCSAPQDYHAFKQAFFVKCTPTSYSKKKSCGRILMEDSFKPCYQCCSNQALSRESVPFYEVSQKVNPYLLKHIKEKSQPNGTQPLHQLGNSTATTNGHSGKNGQSAIRQLDSRQPKSDDLPQTRIRSWGYSEISEKTCSNNGYIFGFIKKCAKPIPQNAHVCPECKTEQYKTKESCPYCYWPLHTDRQKECYNCGLLRPQPPQQAEYVPCVLCSNWLMKSEKKCPKCLAPQSYDALKDATYIKCEKEECGRFLTIDSKKCYSCSSSVGVVALDQRFYSFDDIKWDNEYLLNHLISKSSKHVGQGQKCVAKIHVPQIQTPRPSGFCDPDSKDQLWITFKAIIYKEAWPGWDENSQIYMRFGGECFGDFKYDFGPGEIERNDAADFLCCTFQCHFDKLHINKTRKGNYHLQYKYTVFTGIATTSEEEVFEVLNEYQKQGRSIVNRLVVIPYSKSKERILHYDTLVCPSLIQSDPWPIPSWLPPPLQSAKDFEDKEKMCQSCLKLFLQPFKKIIFEDVNGGSFQEISEISNQVIELLNCLNVRRTQKAGSTSPDNTEINLKSILLSWIDEFIKEFEGKPLYHNMYGIATILLISKSIDSMKTALENIESFLYNNFGSFPSCEPLIDAMTFIKDDSSLKSLVINALESEFNRIISGKKHPMNYECILKVLIGINVLKGISTNEPDKFREELIEENVTSLRTLLRQQNSSIGFMNVVENLRPFFDVYPSLPMNLLYICPVNDFPSLCEHTELNLVLGVMHYNVIDAQGIKVSKFISEPLKIVQSRLLSTNIEAHRILSFQELFKNLARVYLQKLSASEDYKRSAFLVFCVTYMTFCSKIKDETVAERKSHVKEWFEKWIGNYLVIGGDVFKISSSKEELKVWKFILNEDNIKAILETTPHLKDDWDNLIRSVMESRINKLHVSNDKAIVDKFIEIENASKGTPFLVEIYLVRTSIALQRMFENKPSSVKQYLTGSNSKSFTKILGELLLKKYESTSNITLESILEWEMWPSFFTLYESAKKSEDQSSDWISICISAVSKFQFHCENVRNRRMSFQNIKELERKIDRVSELCSVSSELPNLSIMKTRIAERRREYESFVTIEEGLFHFIEYMKKSKVPVKGLETIKRLEHSDTIELVKLYSVDEAKKVQVICYESVKPLLPHIELFCQIVTHEHSSELFDHFWKQQVMKLTKTDSEADGITFEEVVTSIWHPTLGQIKDFISVLKNEQVKLPVLDEVLRKLYGDSLEKCSSDIQRLCKVLSIPDTTWISKFCERVTKYWILRERKQSARLFKKLYEGLKLTGDFTLVNRIANGVHNEECLKSIDQALIDAGEFFKSYRNDLSLRECLQKFADCSAIVKLIKTLANKDVEKSTQEKDVESTLTDLQNFVNIALATAVGGEGDVITDRLVALRTVGSGFGQFIYQLPQDSGYETLRDHCISFQKSDLAKRELLKSSLKLCEEQIEWLKSIRETQGSVEKSSIGQMKNINSLGVYEIGSIKPVQLMSRAEAICVRLVKVKGEKESLPKYKYTFEELRDLESKLVLIAGRKSDERKEVDRFLDTFHSTCRIADVLIELQHHGHSDYIQWCLKFSCNMSMTAKDEEIYHLLKYQAKKMERHLEMWLDSVKEERNKFTELNYFTTPQLLMLREELGQFEASTLYSPSIKPGVMNLLQSITDNTEVTFIKERLDELNSKPSVVEDEESHDEDVDEHAESGDSQSDIIVEQDEVKSKIDSFESQEEASNHWPKPSLKRADLNEDQHGHFIELADAGFHKLLILLAFESCPQNSEVDDIMKWCDEHEKDYNYPGEDYDEDQDSELAEIQNVTDESIKNEESSRHPPSNTPSSPVKSKSMEETQEDEGSPSNHDEAAIDEAAIDEEISATTIDEMLDEHFENMIDVKERVPLDKNHQDVQYLVSMGYIELDAIEALTKFPDDFIQAESYLQDKEDFGLKTNTYTTGSLTRQQSTEQETKLKHLKNMILERLDKDKKNYMPLPKLGRLLQNISAKSNAIIVQPRSVPDPDIIKPGEFNLVVVPPENVLKTTLSLYMEVDGSNPPLPTYEEVLICTKHTNAEEVTLLWKRAFNDPDNKRIFCLVHAELLNYQVCDKSLQQLHEQSRGKNDFKIVIVCSNEEEDKSIIISKLQMFRRSYSGIKSDQIFLSFLSSHFIVGRSNPDTITRGSDVDEDNSRVRVVSSTRAGMGKSLYIQHLADKLSQETDLREDECHFVIPIHGPRVDADSLTQSLNKHINCNCPCIIHIDISLTVLSQMSTLLFNLLILRAVCDSNGHIWRVNPNHLYMIEVTIPHEDKQAKKVTRNTCTVDFLKILPFTTCISPKELLNILSDNEKSDSTTLTEIYKDQFESPLFQRTFQYCQRMANNQDIEKFTYTKGEVKGSQKECLRLLLKKSELMNPSWLELRNFVYILNEQIQRSEDSWFCNPAIVKNTFCGFKTFIVKFMAIMSKDFCASSLKDEVAIERGHDTNQLSSMEKNQILDERKWHKNYHPYLFFNNDAGAYSSLTFVGFNVNEKGDIIDPVKRGVPIMRNVITSKLIDDLKGNRVNLKENYHEWDRETQIDKLSKVMGIAVPPKDPDSSYVLTSDNFIKMLAIQMKFRCNIPVVIMGETGCGKTRLIRYMCRLAAHGGRQSTVKIKKKNMLIMKIHGGITPEDISEMVKEAEDLAKLNKRNYDIDTVLFFDEANTTDAIGLIKEVMCDRRLNGEKLSDNLKFIAACNPYRRHHQDMISKLESAGLGFFVKANEAQEKLDDIPLRELVYRVFDLPPSMRPLVYDFGRLDDDTEDQYTRQMVKERCSAVKELKDRDDLINAVTQVLTWSQSFMKRQTDECSFVSLRDVERALIVFKYFHSKREKFIKLIREKSGKNTRLVGHETWALIMSLSVCYHARLQERNDYETGVVKQFIPPLDIMEDQTKRKLTQSQFKREIYWCQDVLLDNMTLGPNIARNAALKENVFMMAICIQVKIPLFLVGKPGSSKSLAKSIISDSMNEQENEFLKDFNQVHMFSYQCSQLSTPESVIEVFTTAKKFQKQDKKTSVVVLDEVGLAEDSPNLPLKALHPLLEDGTEKNDQEIIAREERVAFIGISNWALDPAKMNRGIMVTRADPNCEELVLSAEQISTSDSEKTKKTSNTASRIGNDDRPNWSHKKPSSNYLPKANNLPQARIHPWGYSETRSKSCTNDFSRLTGRCRKPIPHNTHKCPECHKEQYKSKESCPYCYWPLPVDIQDKCYNCGLPRPQPPQQAEYVPCVLCSNWLVKSEKKCFKCLAPQSYDALQNTTYKKCKECSRFLTIDSSTCYLCESSIGVVALDKHIYSFGDIKWDNEYLLHHLNSKSSKHGSQGQRHMAKIHVPQIQDDSSDQQQGRVSYPKPKEEKAITVKDLLKPYFRGLAKAYLEICKMQISEDNKLKRSFFGQRDFYCLIKMLYGMCEASKQEPTHNQLKHAIKRNFGGYKEFDPYKVFRYYLRSSPATTVAESDIKNDLLNPDCSPLGLIVKSLQTKFDGLSHMGESRYLLFLTENNAALQVLQHKLHETVGLKQQKLPTSQADEEDEERKKEPFVLFGSSFPKDKEYTQVCRNINQIKICMETGRTVILLNLENLYESLYDLLNQYYIVFGDYRYVDLGLQTHKVKCRVDNDFKLILIAERETVYKTFPTPLINRLEKHFVMTSTILLDWQDEVLKRLKEWVEKFTVTTHRKSSYKFSKEDAFVGYQEDTPASVIFQVTKMKKEKQHKVSKEDASFLADVYNSSKKLLLQMASPDALIRLKHTELKYQQKELCRIYFDVQKHDSLTDFVKYQLEKRKTIEGLSIQITTHSHLLSTLELKAISKALGFSKGTSNYFLQKFDSELDFTKALDPIFTASEPKERLLIIQCESGHLYGDLIASARYRIDDQREKVYQLQKDKSDVNCGFTHVIMIVSLPRYVKTRSKRNFMFVGFQGGSWISAHIDDVHVTENTGITLNDAMSASISELFYSKPFAEPSKKINPIHASEAFEELKKEGETLIESAPTDEQISLNSGFVMSSISSLLSGGKKQFFDLEKLTNSGGKGYTQCRRLHFCIQSVISMIAERDELKKTWAAGRVDLLLKLIPDKIDFPSLSIETFYGALVWRILVLLQSHEEKFPHSTDWVLNEASDVTSLQSGGTFQNVLAKKIDQVLTPLFGNILSFVDCYYNLNFICNLKDQLTLNQKLWFRLFHHSEICDFSHLQVHDIMYASSEKHGLPDLQESLRLDFKCFFPFFWIVKEKIDFQIRNCTVEMNDMRETHSRVYGILSLTPLAEALCIIDEKELDKYCNMYLTDFLRCVHNVTRSDTEVNEIEMKVLHNAVYAVARGPNFTDRHCLLSHIVAIHVTFEFHQKEIMWLGQLTSLKAGVLPKLKSKTINWYNTEYIDIHLQAVKLALHDLEIPFESTTKHNFPERHLHLQTCQNIISSILEGASDKLSLTRELRFFWNYLRIIKLFVEHIVLDYKICITFAKRIELDSFTKMKVSDSTVKVCKCDCSKLETLKNIQKRLNSAISKICTTEGKSFDRNKLINILRIKRTCFSEIVSTIFFGEVYNNPTREVVAELIGIVFSELNEANQIKEVNDLLPSLTDGIKPVTDEKVDSPNSFLLQLLLEYDLELVMEELKKHFKKIELAKQSRFLMCVQCFEDARGKAVLKNIMIESQDKLKICLDLLKRGAEVLHHRSVTADSAITVEYLEAVANIRYVCCSMAEILYDRKGSNCGVDLTESENSLLMELKTVCEDEAINDDDSGPGIFLMKQIAREYGVSFLSGLVKSKSANTQWIIPKHLRINGKPIVLYENRFRTVYEKEYECFHQYLNHARLKKSFSDIEEKCKELSSTKGTICMLLAIYQIVTMSYGYSEESLRIPDDVKKSLLSSLIEMDHFSKPLTDVAEVLINGTHYDKLPSLKPTVDESEMLNRLHAEVLVHAVIVFLMKEKTDLFKPFVNFLTSPESMKYSYLPTFPGSVLDESIQAALGGAFNYCPKRHPYFISECRVLFSDHTCPKCGITVPKIPEEELSADTDRIKAQEETETTSSPTKAESQSTEQMKKRDHLMGYILTQSLKSYTTETAASGTKQRLTTKRNDFMGYILRSDSQPPMERGLSQSSCAVLRVLMNACLTWTACTSENAAQGLTELLNLKRDDCPTDLPSFFWQSFKNNIRMLRKCMGESEDEVCLTLHKILKKISDKPFPNSEETKTEAELMTIEDRVKWENSFSRVYIKPIIDGDEDIVTVHLEPEQEQKPEEDVALQFLKSKKELNHKTVLQYLRERSARWHNIGGELGLTMNDREMLDNNRGLNDIRRLEDVIAKWLETDPSWDQFVSALRNLKYNDIIESIETEAQRLKEEEEKKLKFLKDSSPAAPVEDQEEKDNPVQDEQTEKDPLNYAIYEKVAIRDPLQQLWTYRPKVTLQTFFQRLSSEWDDDNNRSKYRILHYLSKHQLMLNATQYLPHIVKLQQKLFNVYNRRIKEIDARKITVREFINKLPKSSAEETEKHFKGVALAWNLVKNSIREYGRIDVPSEYKSVSWDIDTLTIDNIIPNLIGRGVCTIALLEGLVHAHNGFIDHCRFVLKRKNVWAQRQVLVKHIQHCHLVEYQHQLEPMVLSHCHYSLKQSKKHLVYEFDVLEKCFTDRFIHGRPTIKLDILEVKYQEFYYSIANVKIVVEPKELNAREKFEILSELKSSTPDLRSTLDIVQITMGFMSSGQYEATMKLSAFVIKYLKMADRFPSKKALDHCNLEHVLCLWRILSVELALRLLLESDQIPFSGLGNAYLQPLTDKDKEELSKYLQTMKMNGVEELLHSLYEFIETFIRHSQHFIKDSYSLIDTMVNYTDDTFEKYEHSFPKDLTVGQVVTVWKEIAVTLPRTN